MKTLSLNLALLIAIALLSPLHAVEPVEAPRPASTQKPVMLSLEFENVDLGSLASMISSEGGVNVIISDDVTNKKVKNIALSNVSAEEALRAVADASNVEFSKLNDGTFLLRRKDPQPFPRNPIPAAFPVETKPYKLEFTIGNLLTQSIMVEERDTFSIATRVGQHSYKISGSNELSKPDMMVTMKLERTSSDKKGGATTSSFITNMKLQPGESSDSPARAVQVGRIDVNKEAQIITVSVGSVK